ncbi:MAG: SUF system NifU family Fe-S cluster assembly protein [Candidatus Marinimicrobia bacterium]|nr:SUF system NifU family Fe-S cluster assembly protein [Candidatus Neomarinimicrobiota bacterium]
MSEMRDLYQQLILDHYQSPRNKGPLPDADASAQGRNPMCGDEVDVALKFEGDQIEEIKFEGTGCAISQASASIMTTVLKGESVAHARDLLDKFSGMMTTGEGSLEQLGKLAALADVYKYPARVKCAMLSWRAMEASLDRRENGISTE